MKLLVNYDIAHCVQSVSWLNRSCIVHLKSEQDEARIIFGHWAHQDQWESSMLEVLDAMDEKNMRTIIVGDLNVNRDETTQSSEERSLEYTVWRT